MSEVTSALHDGRAQRGAASRQRIIEAMIELVRDGVLEPTAEQVAGRAGLAMRTVFRHFADMDSLYREISRRMQAHAQHLLSATVQADSWQQTLRNLVAKRVRVYEEMMPMRLAADALRHRSPFLQQEAAYFVRWARDALRAVLPPHLAKDRARFEALDCLLSYDAWIRLRHDQRLSITAARQVLLTATDALTAG